jgi:hypothetical protein
LFRFVYNFLTFGKKSFYELDDLDAIALRKWLSIEEGMRQQVLPTSVRNLRAIVAFIFSGWSPGPFLPKHGSGAVSERGIRGVIAKERSRKIPRGIEYLFYRQGNIFLPNETGTTDLSFGLRPYGERSLAFSRLKFVPKDWKSTRSICMEPVAYQNAQQGVRLWIERQISDSVLSGHVFLHDQTVNQRAAAKGSKDSSYDTIDLSSASDSVSWELVKALFPPGVLKYLAATRTRRVELPSGEILEVQKFAPMGSALCFPIQSIIYSAVCMMVGICQTYGKDVSSIDLTTVDLEVAYESAFSKSWRRVGGRFLPFLCYGDDIICDSRMTSNVIACLTSYGFNVNVEKSFTSSQCFRESCGAFCLFGEDVTPLLFKGGEVTERVSIESLASLIGLANRAGQFGYLHLRRHLIAFILRYPIQGVVQDNGINPILFSSDVNQSLSILSGTPRNSHLAKRVFDPLVPSAETNYLWQRDELRSITIGPERVVDASHLEAYYYTQWWRARYGTVWEGPREDPSSKADARGTGARWRWTPTEA